MVPDYWRQKDFFNPSQEYTALVVGCGSIGSYVAFGLARMGFKKVIVVDNDVVEAHNLPNQFFSEIGIKSTISKVDALKITTDKLLNNNPIVIIKNKIENVIDAILINERIDVVCVTVDTMKVRKDLYKKLLLSRETGNYYVSNYLVDGRVGGQFSNIFTVDFRKAESKSYYESQLYEDSEVPELPCTGRSIVDISFQVAGAICTSARKVVTRRFCATHTFHDYQIGQAWVMKSLQEVSTYTEGVNTNGNGEPVEQIEGEEGNGSDNNEQ